ncbi:MAG: CRTAC1 family protein [Myxococcota bacterium]
MSIPVALLTVLLGCTPDPESGTDRDSGPTTTVPEVTADATVRTTGLVTCPDPAARAGAELVTTGLRAELPKKAWFWGVGTIAGDFDQDGVFDLVLPGFWETQWWRGVAGGTFAEIPGGVLRDAPVNRAAGGTTVDYDGDGDLDLLITRFLAPNLLLRNDGDGFVDVSAEAGISPEARRSLVSSWADIDRDGDLDLYVGCYGFIDESGDDPEHDEFEPGDPDWLYLNDGDGTFTDRSELLPPEVHDGYALAGGFHDVDRDGWPDLYVVHDFGRSFPNRLLWNRGGAFELDDNAHGLDVRITGMGLGVGDLNDDGLDDYVMSAWDGNSAMLSGVGGAAWFESVDVLRLQNDLSRAQKIGWGVDLVDMDDDGDLDAPMTYGYLDSRYPASKLQPDALYLQGADGTFVDVAPAWVANQPTIGRGYVPLDLNDDGWIDLVKRDLHGETLVQTATCGDAAWLRVRLHQAGANRFAVGATVVVRAGDQRWIRSVYAGGTNYASGGPPEVHVGLGDLDAVDAIDVIWPDGAVSRVDQPQTRQILDIDRDPASGPDR